MCMCMYTRSRTPGPAAAGSRFPVALPHAHFRSGVHPGRAHPHTHACCPIRPRAHARISQRRADSCTRCRAARNICARTHAPATAAEGCPRASHLGPGGPPAALRTKPSGILLTRTSCSHNYNPALLLMMQKSFTDELPRHLYYSVCQVGDGRLCTLLTTWQPRAPQNVCSNDLLDVCWDNGVHGLRHNAEVGEGRSTIAYHIISLEQPCLQPRAAAVTETRCTCESCMTCRGDFVPSCRASIPTGGGRTWSMVTMGVGWRISMNQP